MRTRTIHWRLIAVMLGLCACAVLGAESKRDDEGWNKLRQQAVNRQRRIIFNNDGNEPVYFCTNVTSEELLRSRTAPLVGSQVGSIFYCTWSSGFGLFTHRTKVGQIFNTREAMFAPNRTQEFLDAGIDPLQVMVKFAHQHDIELFWSMRMNDTHDGAGAEYAPVMFRANKLKQEHPDWLIGSKDTRPKYGAWSAVDYGVPEIRELAFRYCEEVCINYDVDGLELDFFRHAFFFKCSGKGAPCGEMELNQMTGLLHRIRAMMEQVGRTRKRPMLLAVRIPDSVEYCKVIGLDLEKWLGDGLVDLLIVGGYTQLNPWEYSVQLGHKYGVKVYPSLDEPRVRDETARKLRATSATYRGRAMNVWNAGADGVYLFNFFDPHSSLWRELGDATVLRQLDRNYFASVRGLGSMPVPHQRFIHVPTLNPVNPLSITAAKPGRVEFSVGEDLGKIVPPQRATLHLQFNGAPPAKPLHVILNDTELVESRGKNGWLEISLGEKAVQKGNNRLTITCSVGEKETLSLADLYISVVHE